MSAIKAAIYLDANAGAPLRPSVVEVLRSLLGEGFVPNPSSIHAHGRRAKRVLNVARDQIAASLGSAPQSIDSEQLVFTSSGTEANQIAVSSILDKKLGLGQRAHWITTPVEHDSVLQMIRKYETRGVRISFLPVDSNGAPIVSALRDLWTAETALVSSVWVNNETGVITQVPKLAREVRDLGGVLHLDAAQAWGKIPVQLDHVDAQLVTFSGHKIGGLAGTGLIYIQPGTAIQSLIHGKQERGRRGGTESVLGIAAMGEAASKIDPQAYGLELSILRDRLQALIQERIPGTLVNGIDGLRVSNTLNLNFDGVEGDGLVMALDLAGYSVSSGSACASGVLEPSHVLLAMGRSKGQSMAALRISLSQGTTWDQLEGFVPALEKVVDRLRKQKNEFNRIRTPEAHRQ